MAKSRKARKAAKRCLEAGVDLILMGRRQDGAAGGQRDRRFGSHPGGSCRPGTANLLAHNLGIPIDLDGALDVALHGKRRDLDVGVISGRQFAVMAGAGLDAVMIGTPTGS